jgi:hypothetical protein
MLLAMLRAGPLYGAFPVAFMLYKKGASIKNIFIYLGIKFTLVRTLVPLPLFIGIGYLVGRYLKDKNFVVHEL